MSDTFNVMHPSSDYKIHVGMEYTASHKVSWLNIHNGLHSTEAGSNLLSHDIRIGAFK